MDKFVLYFEEVDKRSLPYVGGKGANLGEMTKAGFPVPDGFCITTFAYQAFIQTSDEMSGFFTRLDRIHAGCLDEIRLLGQQIRNHLERVSIPDAVEAAILEAWQRTGQENAYAVRSSATAEDLPTASFAGQQDTYLNVRGRQQLLDSIRRCWASLFTDRAISYRAKNGFDHRQVFLSVVVQKMVFPDVSGILFTADPITGNRKVTAIDASFGLGEALVSGLVSADLYQVRGGQIIQKKISSKKIAIFSIPEGGTLMKELPLDLQASQALADEKIIQLAELGQQIKEHYGHEQDIEWCLADGKFYLVQARPITSLYPVPEVSDQRLHAFISVGHQQMMTDAMRPLGISVLRTFFPFGQSDSPGFESPFVVEAGSHLYFDITNLLNLKPAKKLLPKILRNIDERIGSAIAELAERPEFHFPAGNRFLIAARKAVLIAAKNVIAGLLFRDSSQARLFVNEFMNRSLEECEFFIFEAAGAERIHRIQKSLGTLMLSIIEVIVRHVASGIVAMLLVNQLAKKWGASKENIQQLNKSLPGNVTSELGLQIGDLADCARLFPEVIQFLQRATDATFFEELGHVQGGGEFGREFQQFLVTYGMRCPGEIDITNPRWREVPTTLVPAILSHIRTQKPGEHRQKFEQGRIEAEAAANCLLAQVRRTRGGRWKARILARLIRIYRNSAGMREYPKYIIVRHFDIFKRAIMENARTLVESGQLHQESDVFFLSLGELLDLENGCFSGNAQFCIEGRKQKYEQNKKLVPPRVMTSDGEVITGRWREINAPDGALIGSPVSPGVVEGYAKVVLRPEEAELHPGEILIAPFTDPGWTPLFHSAKGLVMEVGGMMTHGAVVAREYGIPAVVGIDGATGLIKDGDYIRVDGTKGYVEVLQRSGTFAN